MTATLTAHYPVVNDIYAATLDDFLASVERRAFRIAEIATRDRDEALDLVQDAMMKLARHYANHPPGEWAPLFFRILQNRITDWQRRQTIKRRLMIWQPSAPEEDEPEPEPQDPAAIDMIRHLEGQEALRVLESALRALPARQREAFELRVWEGLSVEETALAMGCGEGSVKTHLSRALTALRKRLNGVWS